MPHISSKTAIGAPLPAKPVHQHVREIEYREVSESQGVRGVKTVSYEK